MRRIAAVVLIAMMCTMLFAEVKKLTKRDFLDKVYNFEKNPKAWVYESSRPCVIDFYATWCGPCKAVAPILEEFSERYKGQIDFYKVDVDAEPALSQLFGIRSIPTFLFCPVGAQPQMAQGAMNKEGFERAISEIILKK